MFADVEIFAAHAPPPPASATSCNAHEREEDFRQLCIPFRGLQTARRAPGRYRTFNHKLRNATVNDFVLRRCVGVLRCSGKRGWDVPGVSGQRGVGGDCCVRRSGATGRTARTRVCRVVVVVVVVVVVAVAGVVAVVVAGVVIVVVDLAVVVIVVVVRVVVVVVIVVVLRVVVVVVVVVVAVVVVTVVVVIVDVVGVGVGVVVVCVREGPTGGHRQEGGLRIGDGLEVGLQSGPSTCQIIGAFRHAPAPPNFHPVAPSALVPRAPHGCCPFACSTLT